MTDIQSPKSARHVTTDCVTGVRGNNGHRAIPANAAAILWLTTHEAVLQPRSRHHHRPQPPVACSATSTASGGVVRACDDAVGTDRLARGAQRGGEAARRGEEHVVLAIDVVDQRRGHRSEQRDAAHLVQRPGPVSPITVLVEEVDTDELGP